jgi:hypothetical protein
MAAKKSSGKKGSRRGKSTKAKKRSVTRNPAGGAARQGRGSASKRTRNSPPPRAVTHGAGDGEDD